MREAVLAELGLMPLWQLRPLPAEAAEKALPDMSSAVGELIVIKVLGENGVPGWILMCEEITGEATLLFANMLRAMRLRQVETMLFAYAQLSETVVSNGVQWIWLMGEAVVSRIFDKALQLPLSNHVSTWQNLPVLISSHPREFLLRPQEKAALWSAWCTRFV